MRKIRKDEIKKVARLMASSFAEYPLYNVFFDNDKKKENRIFYFFWFRIFTRRDFTYISEDESVALSFLKPGDKLLSCVPLLLNPCFVFGFLFNVPLKSLLLVSEYSKMEEIYHKKYYNPKEDWYVQAMCVLKKERGKGKFFKAYQEADEGKPLFCETHVEDNVKLYEGLGFKVCEKADFYGVTHYVMKRDAVNTANS